MKNGIIINIYCHIDDFVNEMVIIMRLTKPQKLIYDMEKFVGGSISVICGSMLLPDKHYLADLQSAVTDMYRLNDALRIHIVESNGKSEQVVADYMPKEIPMLHFESKAELDTYAQEYAKAPLNFYGALSEFKIVTLPERCGILVKLHHIIGDAWTLSLIGNQFNALLNGETPEAYSYADYLDSEDAYQQSKRFTKDKSFFLEQFKKCDEATYLSEKSSDSYNAERKTFVIGPEQARIISDYAQEKEVSVFTLFASILAVYMNRVKMNAEKFYVGTAVLNRGNAKEKNTMGMFINTVPMLMELDNQKSFAENLSAVEDVTLAVLRHQKYNYGDVLADLRKEFGFTEKLYDVIISYQNATVTENGCETTWYPCGMQTESLQIHIDDRDNEGIYRVHYDYLTDKFTAHEIEALHLHFCNLLFDAIDHDGLKPYELHILSPDEKQVLQYSFNDTAMEYPIDQCVHQLFEAQAEMEPDRVAVVSSDETLTYRELNAEANRIAHSLIDRGVGAGDIVAIILPRVSHLIPAMFGVLKSGAAYMPLDPSYPQERIDYLISESGANLVINEANLSDYLSSDQSDNPQIAVSPSDLFCALHTSGSTGNPKVTALTQQNLLNFLYANLDFWDGVETVISVTIVTFDIFMQDSLLSLALGKKVILASNEQIYNQTEFEKMFENEKNVMFFSTPTKLMSYIKQSKTADFLKTIRSLIVGGEVFTDELYDLLMEKIGAQTLQSTSDTTPTENSEQVVSPPPPAKFQNRIMQNCYGPCETTILITREEQHL